MYNRELYELVKRFRFAMEEALKNGEFKNDSVFKNFPIDCCGETCDLLAYYLYHKNYNTIYVCGEKDFQTHAWLVLKNEQVKEPERIEWGIPNYIEDALKTYNGGNYTAPENNTYEWKDIKDGLIIDITADQFDGMNRPPYYIGPVDKFYRSFKIDFAEDSKMLLNERLCKIYESIIKYM